MANKLEGKKIAIVATDGFEYSELTKPKEALEAEGAETEIISIKSGEIKGESKGEPAGTVSVDKTFDEADASDYDGLLLPGGVKNPDTLRMHDEAVAFVKEFVEAEAPIAAICHGPWTLINAGGVEGKEMTSWPSLRLDLENAGATWVDKEVVVDVSLVTSRKPDDIPAFNREMITLFAST
jgi:protease I